MMRQPTEMLHIKIWNQFHMKSLKAFIKASWNNMIKIKVTTSKINLMKEQQCSWPQKLSSSYTFQRLIPITLSVTSAPKSAPNNWTLLITRMSIQQFNVTSLIQTSNLNLWNIIKSNSISSTNSSTLLKTNCIKASQMNHFWKDSCIK